MSLALRQPDAARIPPPWVPLAEAACKLGCHRDSLGRRCRKELAAAGLARSFPTGWGVHPDVDIRLRDIETWSHRDLRQLAELRAAGVSARHLAIAEFKRDLVVGLEDFACPGLHGADRVAAYIAGLLADGTLPADGVKRLSPKTLLYNWRPAWLNEGLAGLVRRKNDRRATDPIGPAAFDYMKALVFSGNSISVRAAWTMARGKASEHADDPAWHIPAYTTVLGEFRKMPKPLRVMADHGERAFNARCVPKGRCDYESIAANHQWVGDERTLDIFCRLPDDRGGWKASRKVVLTAWMDRRSRVITGWMLRGHADSNTILGSLRMGIRQHGKPDRLLVDWGKDYRKATGSLHHKHWDIQRFDGSRIGGVLDRLGIEVSCAIPFFPWSKPIESFFSTMKNHFDRTFPSFAGGSPAERHEGRFRWATDHLHKLPTITELARLFDRFIGRYHRTPHGGAGMFGYTPVKAMAEFREGPARFESDDVLEFVFCEFVGPRVVRRDGVKYGAGWYGWGDPRVMALQGRKVFLGLQPDDISYAWLCDADQKPLFRVESEGNKYRSKRDAERLGKMRARGRRRYAAEARRFRKLIVDTPVDQRLDDHDSGGAAPPGPADMPAPLRVVTVRPELEEALAKAPLAPSEGPSSAARESDDTAELIDLIDDMPGDARPPPDDDDEDTDELTFEDLTGEL